MPLMRALIAATALLGACSTRIPPSPTIVRAALLSTVSEDAAVATVTLDVVEATNASDVVTEASVDASDGATVSDDERLLRAVAAGTVPIGSVIDPARGIVVTRYLEAGPRGGHRTIVQHRLCGAAVEHDTSLHRMLTTAMAQADNSEIDCGDDDCAVPGMEWTASFHARFARGATGNRVLVRFSEQSEADLPDAWVTRANTFAAQAEANALSHPCPH